MLNFASYTNILNKLEQLTNTLIENKLVGGWDDFELYPKTKGTHYRVIDKNGNVFDTWVLPLKTGTVFKDAKYIGTFVSDGKIKIIKL